MKKIILFVLAIFALAFSACSPGEEKLNSAKLRELIAQAMDRNREANIALKGLVDTELTSRKDFNSLRIDSGLVNNKYYYSVLLEYFDPLLNRFAIYDDELRLYLVDKSLNGNISAQWTDKDNRHFVFVQERFLTKDVLSIDRLSIYEVYDTTAGLVYRSISRLVKDKHISTQTIENISADFIITKISGIAGSKSINQIDTFYFYASSKEYLSSNNLFNNFVKQEIDDFLWINTKPQIPSSDLKNNPLP